MTDAGAETIDKLKEFATRHDLIFEANGECGFGRPCVGFVTRRGNYVDYNPQRYCAAPRYYEDVWPHDSRLLPPDGVEAYHKHDCMAVLVQNGDYAAALEGLRKWVEHLDAQGATAIQSYKTGADGIQAIVSGVTGYAVRFKE